MSSFQENPSNNPVAVSVVPSFYFGVLSTHRIHFVSCSTFFSAKRIYFESRYYVNNFRKKILPIFSTRRNVCPVSRPEAMRTTNLFSTFTIFLLSWFQKIKNTVSLSKQPVPAPRKGTGTGIKCVSYHWIIFIFFSRISPILCPITTHHTWHTFLSFLSSATPRELLGTRDDAG